MFAVPADPSLAHDTVRTTDRVVRFASALENRNVPVDRVIFDVPATFEGIQAAKALQSQGISCNLTLVFSRAQAIACAEAKCALVSPQPGKMVDWSNERGRRNACAGMPGPDEGALAVAGMRRYFRQHGHDATTRLAPEVWSPRRGERGPFELDEIREMSRSNLLASSSELLNVMCASYALLPEEEGAESWTEEEEREQQQNAVNYIDNEEAFLRAMKEDTCRSEDLLRQGLRENEAETEELFGIIDRL